MGRSNDVGILFLDLRERSIGCQLGSATSDNDSREQVDVVESDVGSL